MLSKFINYLIDSKIDKWNEDIYCKKELNHYLKLSEKEYALFVEKGILPKFYILRLLK